MRPEEIYGLIDRLKNRGQPDGTTEALLAVLQHAADMEIERHGAFHLDAKTIFDVGANIGDSTRWFRKAYPSAKIHSFEPVSSTFLALSERVKHPLTECEQLAFGAEPGRVTISARPLSPTNKILIELPKKRVSVEDVEQVAGAPYCASRGIDEIDILKIDTEGRDLDVLIGFRPMITSGKIKYIQVEAGMNPENQTHVNIREFLRWLQPKGYRMSSIHSPSPEKNSPVLRRVDIVFVYAAPPSVANVDNSKG